MTIADVKERLASIVLETPGIKRAYACAPQSLPDSDLPLVVIFTGVSIWSTISDGLAEETRTYLIRLYVAPIQSGYDGEAERRVEPYLDTLRAAILKHPHLGNSLTGETLPGVRECVYNGDTGIAVLPYAGQNYLGAELRVNVSTFVTYDIASYE